MAEWPPWSVPAFTNVIDDIVLPWSGPALVDVDDRNGADPPWSNNAQVRIAAPPTIDWRPLEGPLIRLPSRKGWRHGQALMPLEWPATTVDEMLAMPVFEIAHRGFGNLRPEMTMTAYMNAARLGAQMLEVSVVMSSDNVFVCHHDDSTLRATGTDYYIPTTPWRGAIENLRVNWSQTDTPGRDPVPISRLDEVVEEFGRTHVLWIQPKRDIDAPTLITWLNQSPYIDQQHAIVKLWRGQWPYANLARANGGWLSWGIWVATNSIKPELTVHFDLLGQDITASDAQWNEVLSSGKRVVGHLISNAAGRDLAFSRGATALMATRPVLNL